MDYRKLISFGKNSFVISLPKTWIRHSKLKKGDLIYVEEGSDHLILRPHPNNDDEEEKKITINVDGKPFSLIEREVNAAYIANNRSIILKGKEIKTNIRELQSVIQNLIALEIMEQNSDTIISRDFLDMDKVSLKELVRKIDVVTKTMVKETSNIFNEENYDNINERDKDVNRLYFLIYRTCLFNLNNPTKALKNFNLTPVELLKINRMGFYLEGVADEARRTARFAKELKPSPKEKKEIEDIFDSIYQFLQDTMKTLYNDDYQEALNISERKKSINKKLEELEEKDKDNVILSKVISRIRRMASYIHNLGRLVYTAR